VKRKSDLTCEESVYAARLQERLVAFAPHLVSGWQIQGTIKEF
jgi:hypothetical protein